MPIYEYLCTKCRMSFEKIRPNSDFDKFAKCPQCHSEAQKLISASACKVGPRIQGVEKPSKDSSIKEYSPKPTRTSNQILLRALRDKIDWAEFDLVRYSATSAAAGVLLIVTPPTQLAVPYLSIVLFLVAFLFLIADVGHFLNRWPGLFKKVISIGDTLSIAFLIISLLSIAINWAKIMESVYGSPAAGISPIIEWIQTGYSRAIIIWLIVFAVTLIWAALRMLIIAKKSFGTKNLLARILPLYGISLGCYFALELPFTSGIEGFPKLSMIAIYAALIILITIFISRQKSLLS